MKKLKVLLILGLILVSATAVQAAETKITDIKVVGNDIIPKSAILGQLETEVGVPFDRDKLKKDLQTIMNLGYFSNLNVDFQPYKTGMRLIIQVKEYPLISAINIKGNTVIKDAALKETLGLQTGQIMNAKQFKKGLKEIEKHYADQGYKLARVVNRNFTAGGKLEVEVAEGRLNQIIINGNERTKDYVVTREFSLKPGDVINFNQLRKDIHKIYRLGYFKPKTFKTKFKRSKENPGQVDLVLNVEEARTRSITGGVSYSPGSGATGFGEFKNKNLFGEGKKFHLKLEHGPNKDNYLVNYSQPWTFGRPMNFDLGLYHRRDTTPDGSEVMKRGGNIGLGYPLAYDFRGSINLDIKEIEEESGWSPEHSISLQAVRNTSNRSFNPTTGSLVRLSTEKSGIFGGSTDYTKYETDFRKYYPAGKKGSIATRLKLGTAEGDLPDYERFFLTGRGGVRGYASSHYSGEESFTGDSMAVTNLEYRYPFMDNRLTGLVFADAGRSFTSGFEADKFNDLNYSFGVGLRFRTPLGQLGVDYGYAPAGDPGHKTDYQFAVGNKF